MSWFDYYPKQESAKCRLFCFPFSGGLPSIFLQWSKRLPVDLEVEVIGVCLPGRGKRFSHPHYLSMKELVLDIAKAIIPLLDKPYFFYGHSLGGYIAYEVVQELRTLGTQLPLRLFVGACLAPIFKKGLQPGITSHRDKTLEQIKQVLRDLGGTPEEVLNSKELMDILLPMVKSDLTVGQEYAHERVDIQLPVPITYFKGTKDTVLGPEKQTWDVHTSVSYKQIDLDSGHFFLTSHSDLLLDFLAKEIKESLNSQQ